MWSSFSLLSKHSIFVVFVVFVVVIATSRLSLKPLGSSVSCFYIQKSSLFNSVFRTCSRVIFFSAISSIMIILKPLLKSWSFSWKCWSMLIEPSFLASFLCLFIRLWAFWDSTLSTVSRCTYRTTPDTVHPSMCTLFFV